VMVIIIYILSFDLVMFFFMLIFFFTFFILYKEEKPIMAIRLSLAVTRGIFAKIVMLLGFFALFGSLYLYFSYRGYPVISTVLSLVNSFIIIPLSSVAFVIAYRKMMHDYHGDSDPSIMENII